MFTHKWEGKVFETDSFGVIFNKIPIYKYLWDNVCKEMRGETHSFGDICKNSERRKFSINSCEII